MDYSFDDNVKREIKLRDCLFMDLHVEINFICLHPWFVSGGVGIPAVNLKLLDPGFRSYGSCSLSMPHHLHHGRESQRSVTEILTIGLIHFIFFLLLELLLRN